MLVSDRSRISRYPYFGVGTEVIANSANTPANRSVRRSRDRCGTLLAGSGGDSPASFSFAFTDAHCISERSGKRAKNRVTTHRRIKADFGRFVLTKRSD